MIDVVNTTGCVVGRECAWNRVQANLTLAHTEFDIALITPQDLHALATQQTA